MQFKIFIFIFLIFSCTPNHTKIENRKPLNTTGFAYLYSENDYNAKIIKKKLNNELLQISHKNLRTGTLIKLINPRTKESIVLKNLKRINYPEFYKILITKPVAKKLNINTELPIIEVLELKKNKSFIAEKAKIYQEEKKISAKAPVATVEIANISKNEYRKKNTVKGKIYILVASFYTKEAANLLKQRIIKEIPDFNYNILGIRKRSDKEFEVLSGPYKSINLVKNDYIDLKKFGFEELNIFINE